MHSHHSPAAKEWSVLLLHDVICSERVTMHCQWGEKNPNCPFALGFRHLAGGRPSHGHRQRAQKIGKDRACGSGDILSDRHTNRRAHHNHRSRIRYLSKKNSRILTNFPKLKKFVITFVKCPSVGLPRVPVGNRVINYPCNFLLPDLQRRFALYYDLLYE